MNNNDLPTIDQLKEIKEQYCKFKCPKTKDCYNNKFDDYYVCEINNFIEELYHNKIIGL